MTVSHPRMGNPVTQLPGSLEAIQALLGSMRGGAVPQSTLELTHLLVSEINGCAVCLDSGAKQARSAGETEERLGGLRDWRDASVYSDAERAAFALAESLTKLDGSGDPVSDGVWDEAAKHYGEAGMATLVMSIGVTNLFNRLNLATRQVPGSWG